MDRYWLLTWTTYGTWLPGDDRGFVSSVYDGKGGRVVHNLPHTPQDAGWERLSRFAQSKLKCAPVVLDASQAGTMLLQFHETAQHRRWLLIASAIMRNHVHIVVGVSGDPLPEDILRDFKSYASRTLNRAFARSGSGTWWTESGSKRKLKDEAAILGAVAYVRDQEYPLSLWIHPDFLAELGSGVAPGKQ